MPEVKSEGKFKCPECGKRRKTARHLGMHRKAAHGVVAQSRSAQLRAAAKAGKPLGRPPRITTQPTTLDLINKNLAAIEAIEGIVAGNGHARNLVQQIGLSRFAAHLAIEIKSQLRGYAESNGIEPEDLAQRVGEYLPQVP